MSRFVLVSCVLAAALLGSGCGSFFDKYPTGSRGRGETCEESLDCEGSLLCSDSGVCTSSSGGGSCGTGGDSCSDGCCSSYICVNWSYEPKSCAASCTRSSQCNSGCCVSLSGGGGACNTPGPNSDCL